MDENNNSNNNATSSTTNMYNSYNYYEDGDEIQQSWDPAFVIFAYLIAFLSSYAAVHLLDHGLWFWRSKELKKSAIIKYPDIYAACMLGLGTVWCMHFVGMSAVGLEGTPICYNWGITMGSLIVVIVFMIAGVKVAGNDIFATPDRDMILDEILISKYLSHRDIPKRYKFFIVSFYKLHYLALGSFLAASGAIVMHYTGMMAQRGPFQKEWNPWFIAASAINAIVICFVGFWIIFRLRWNIQQLGLRFISAAMIALAVCGLHFFGMVSVTYYYDDESIEVCNENLWDSSSPNDWTTHQDIMVALVIVVLALVILVEIFINQELLIAYEVAAKSNEIVTSLFPPQIRERLLASSGNKNRLRSFLSSGDNSSDGDRTHCVFDDDNDADVNRMITSERSKPIADLFTDTTIMFADIAGFTAWSSQREPSQVFILLEQIYGAFDEISERHRVFKVETVGDCYVCVSGLPDPREDHAAVMCKVARDCVKKMNIMTKKLEVLLGPDTTDLKIRVGLHSGPVTAGVLRGKSARFQIFGDTVNVASRMESTGLAGRIQISTETANILKNAGKEAWITPREELIMAKGKGKLQTFWVLGDKQDSSSSYSRRSGAVTPSVSPKVSRLIKWNVECLTQLLRQIAARRQVAATSSAGVVHERNIILNREEGKTVLDEVQDYIVLPEIDLKIAKNPVNPSSIELDDDVIIQLHDYVSLLAAMYNNNPFHNFEHASHVTMSVSKLLSRIVAPSDMEFENSMAMNQTLHDHTYGITSDPLTQFSCVLAGLIHDVDHSGVPNTTLIKEKPELADYYKGRSVAEQNSVDVAFDMLMEDHYTVLRKAIYTTDDELHRFRQLTVNAVMATDIADKEIGALRKKRWEKAFSESANDEEDPQAKINRKATIVIEHLIQASDVAHCMQHWHVFLKWNERLFKEMYKAYLDGRSETDPSKGWFQGEIGFFDFYIIPLAKKLESCGVFGVSSEEYLAYAQANRKEWEAKGEAVVAEYLERYQKGPGDLEQVAEGSNGSEKE